MSERTGPLKKLVEVYKYHSVRAAAFVLAELLEAVIDKRYVLVPLPTIRKHIRERGFDHIGLVCRKTGFDVRRVLIRNNDSVQVGADNERRRLQARLAYKARAVEPDTDYLLVDDVWTTGSSMMAACKEMKKAGAKKLAVAIIARS